MIKQWAWQHDDWPNYTIDPGALESEEIEFAARMESQSLRLAEANPDDQLALQIEWLTDEAVQTSAIEGEMLRRDSVQESLMRRMGLRPNARRHDNAEEGIAAMMVDLYRNATRDLNALVEIGILRRTGSLRHTRYWLDWQSLENLM